MPTPSELKKSLIAQGFEIYRTSPDQVALADRVRDNLLMDAGVAVCIDYPAVRVVLRAQGTDHPGESAEQIYDRVRVLADPVSAKGYREIACREVKVHDPGDRSRTLDVWYEVVFERQVDDDDELGDEVRFALSLEKTLPRR